MLKLLIGGIMGLGAIIGGLFVSHQTVVNTPDYTPSFGAYSPTGGSTYRLGQSVGTSDTTIRLSSFKEPVSNIPYTMTYLNSDIEYGTLSPQSSVSEFISFSGISQNSDGSATLTGVTRGLSRTPGTGGCVASTTLAQSHAGQSILILSNPPCQIAEYPGKRNTETISGAWTFSTLPTFTNAPAATTDGVNKAYADALAIQGAATSTFANLGLVRLGTSVQLASSTASSTSGAPLVTLTKYGTTTPGLLCNSGIWNCFPVAQVSGKISQLWLDLTAAFTFSTTTQYVANTGTLTATTTANLPQATNINSVSYTWPSAQGAANSVPVNNGSGVISWGTPQGLQYNFASTSQSALAASKTVTSANVNIPASTLTASSSVTYMLLVNSTDAGSGGSATYTLEDSNSNTYLTDSIVPGTSHNCSILFTVKILALTTSSQQVVATGLKYCDNATSVYSATNATSVNWSNAVSFRFKFATGAGSGSTGTVYPFTIEVKP